LWGGPLDRGPTPSSAISRCLPGAGPGGAGADEGVRPTLTQESSNMNRRQLLHVGAGAALTAAVRAQQSNPKQKIDAYSRHLQWLRSPDEVAEAALEMGFD